MIELTQTSLYPRGNCWQTAVACVLDLPAEALPSQFDSYYEDVDGSGVVRIRMNYNNPLQAYLNKHHGLAYVEFHQPQEALAQLAIHGYHLITGTSVRSADYDGTRHVVVGKDGQVAWDPHPSRAGLLDEIRWAVLCSWPKLWNRQASMDCVCPSCLGAKP